MTTTALRCLKVQKRIQSTVSCITMPRINWKAVCFAALAICLMLLFFYVWQVRYLTNGSYLADSYERQVDKLLSEKNDLEVSFAENSFLVQAQEKIRSLNFEKTALVKYIRLPDNYLARAK